MTTGTLTPEALATGVDQTWADEVRRLAKEQDATILAHNYQVPAIQDVADFVGDSLELSRIAAEIDESTIVFCGVHFMAETAKILAPEKKVLIPDPQAGCSLAASITPEQLIAWQAEHPGSVTTMYVNTTAAIKALTDYCVTSANAANVVNSIPADKEILFGPDMFLGAHVERVTGRKMHIWMGECHVHAGIQPDHIQSMMAEHPDAELHVHPECGCSSQCMYLMSTGDLPADRTFVLGTGGMVRRAHATEAKEVIVATEVGMLHRLHKEAPDVDFIPANAEARCGYMGMITPAKLLRTLQTGEHEVTVPPDIIDKARVPIERMIAVG
ncbi:MAG: quinolinate synthase [Actinomycetota bacterium]|jgi:quinolinate synthase|nr:quinolinate synthase [Actinomycetota bacterium]